MKLIGPDSAASSTRNLGVKSLTEYSLLASPIPIVIVVAVVAHSPVSNIGAPDVDIFPIN